MSEQWYYTRNKQQQGPVSQEQLKQLAAAGQLQPTDMVWKEGLPQWVAANTLSGLFAAAAPAVGAPPQAFKPAPPAVAAPQGGLLTMLDVNFTRFVTSLIVRWLWQIWLSLAAIALVGAALAALLTFQRSVPTALMILVGSPFAIALYTVLVRISLETMVILFRIAEYLREMNARQTDSAK